MRQRDDRGRTDIAAVGSGDGARTRSASVDCIVRTVLLELGRRHVDGDGRV